MVLAQLLHAYVRRSGSPFEPIYLSAFVLTFVCLGFATRRFARRQRGWLLFATLTVLFAFVGVFFSVMLVVN